MPVRTAKWLCRCVYLCVMGGGGACEQLRVAMPVQDCGVIVCLLGQQVGELLMCVCIGGLMEVGRYVCVRAHVFACGWEWVWVGAGGCGGFGYGWGWVTLFVCAWCVCVCTVCGVDVLREVGGSECVCVQVCACAAL